MNPFGQEPEDAELGKNTTVMDRSGGHSGVVAKYYVAPPQVGSDEYDVLDAAWLDHFPGRSKKPIISDLVADVMEACADYMTEVGHTKYTLIDNDGSVCLTGAVDGVTNGWPSWQRTLFMDHMEAVVRPPQRPMALIMWNDYPETTQEQVVEGFRKAAKVARGAPLEDASDGSQ